ncbi:hypothetical protein LTR62_003860 [Meristemomyces frigidus]|uniref:Uncharacterized protein n=1 Tax=Meristemomyces frigidus TaxID=1508187 RepID=A0AAN7TRD3_9PEZI|nr:hypothetical protein LTR62_003860 [Meristemomyces frigidus]
MPYDPQSASPDDLQNQVDEVRAVRHYMRLVEKSLLLRTQLQNDQQALERSHDFLLESVNKLHDLLDLREHTEDATCQHSDLAAARDQYETDLQALRQEHRSCSTLQTKLGALDFRLSNMQQEFVKTYRQLRTQLSATALESISSSASTAPTASHSDTPTLLRKYFDRKGDAGIYRERLMELDEYHYEGVVTREMFRDRGEPLETSEVEFVAQYEEQRRGIVVGLEAAEADAKALKQQCEDNHLSVEAGPPRALSGVSSTHGSFGFVDVVTPILRRDLFLGSGDAPRLISSEAASDLQVEQWLSHVLDVPAVDTSEAVHDGEREV